MVSFVDTAVELLKDEFVQEKMDEMARLFYSNDSVTINLYWAAAAALLTLLCKIFSIFIYQCFPIFLLHFDSCAPT